MAVSGSIDAPVLGLADASGSSSDLRDCPLYGADMHAALQQAGEFVSRARIEPYDIPQRRGELKHLLLTRAADSGELMLRFVLRSNESVTRIRKHLPWLRRQVPALRVVSANLQPEHKAILEGDTEILFDGPERLAVPINAVPLFLRPGCFWQTNDAVAAALYQQVRDWCREIDPPTAWDLYCGVGGFALHCADGHRRITGIESSAAAIRCANDSRDALGDGALSFHAGDAIEYADHAADPALLIVNPPRRGLGPRLCRRVDAMRAEWMVYSSCNAESLATDLQQLPNWRARRARLFDMFPHTRHYELAVLLQRRA